MRRDLGPALMARLTALVRETVVYSLAHRKEALAYAMSFARGMDPAIADRFVGMWVNDMTVDCGRARAAGRPGAARSRPRRRGHPEPRARRVRGRLSGDVSAGRRPTRSPRTRCPTSTASSGRSRAAWSEGPALIVHRAPGLRDLAPHPALRGPALPPPAGRRVRDRRPAGRAGGRARPDGRPRPRPCPSFSRPIPIRSSAELRPAGRAHADAGGRRRPHRQGRGGLLAGSTSRRSRRALGIEGALFSPDDTAPPRRPG